MTVGIRTVRLSQLRTDDRVNRPIDEAWINRLVKNWDDRLLGVPSVSQNGGDVYTIIDGQHRIEALRQMHSDDMRLQVEVVATDGIPEQAYQFVGRNTTRRVPQFQRFAKRVNAGEAMPCQIVKVLKAHGLHLDTSHAEGAVAAVAALERVANLDGTAELLGDALGVLVAAWGRDPKVFNGDVIQGVARFLKTWPDARKRLTTSLTKLPGGPAGLTGRARTLREVYGGTMPLAAAEQCRLLHNRGLRTGKLEW